MQGKEGHVFLQNYNWECWDTEVYIPSTAAFSTNSQSALLGPILGYLKVEFSSFILVNMQLNLLTCHDPDTKHPMHRLLRVQQPRGQWLDNLWSPFSAENSRADIVEVPGQSCLFVASDRNMDLRELEPELESKLAQMSLHGVCIREY